MIKSKTKISLRIWLLIFGLAAVLFLSLYIKSQVELAKIKSQGYRGDEDIRKILSKVEKNILLPEDETPTVATISDVEKLKSSQLFFAKAENGDKVLIYTKAKKAILYRPSIAKIIEVAPIDLEEEKLENQKSSTASAVTEP